MELWVLSRHFGQHRGEVGRTEGQWHGDSQATAQITSWENRLPGRLDLGDDPGCMIPERYPGFRESGSSGRPDKELHAEFRPEPDKPSTGNRFRDAEPTPPHSKQ